MDKNNTQNKTKTTNKNLSIPYQGVVTAKVIRNGKVVKTFKKHNKGTDFLFKQLCRCLAGQDVRDAMPRYIDAGTIDNTENKFKSELIQPSFITGKYVKKFNSQYYAVVLNALIPFSSVISNESIINTFVLKPKYDSLNDSILAIFELNGESVRLEQGESLLIEWKMAFTSIDISEGEDN